MTSTHTGTSTVTNNLFFQKLFIFYFNYIDKQQQQQQQFLYILYIYSKTKQKNFKDAMHDIAVYYIIALCILALGFLLYVGIDITKNNKNIAKKINQFRKADKFA